MKTIRLKKKEERRILRGHPWAFSNELLEIPAGTMPGETIDLLDYSGRFLARGYVNPRSLIAVRILSRLQEEIDADFFRKRISAARSLRKSFGFGDSFRAVFSEGDGLPGLIVDKYADALVVQASTAGIDARLPEILSALGAEYQPATIVLRNDSASRELEGLPLETRVVLGAVDGPILMEESGIRYGIDVLEGQKTGFFFDQRENRSALRGLVQGKRTLDCFCYVGAWSLNAARYGASEVIALDSSEKALSAAAANARLNGLNVTFRKTDVFAELRRLDKEGDRFGCIILDPPAFVKSKNRIREAVKGYKEINLRALKILDRGGFLVTCSCSHHIGQDLFRELLADAAADSGRQVRLIEMRFQARDHPMLLAAPETQYLKCAVLSVT